jgi:prepilin-type N-terminal cleavage/methylation domain-containing protein
MLQNEKGITLVEILAAMTILSIILLSIAHFFPQVGWLNHQNNVKTNGINEVKEVLMEWTHSEEVIHFLSDADNAPVPEGYQGKEKGYHIFRTTRDSFSVHIKIKEESDLNSNPSGAHYIHVELFDEKGTSVSETYGYVLVQGEAVE